MSSILESIQFKTIFTKELSKELKAYGFRNYTIAKQISEAIQQDTISYSKYQTMFRSILNTSKDLEWDIKSGIIYKVQNYKAQIPSKKKNPFFIVSKRHIQGKRATEYEITPLLQNMLNNSWQNAITNITIPKSTVQNKDFTIALNDFILLSEKDKTALRKHTKGINNNRLVFECTPKGTYRKFSLFTQISQDTRDKTEFTYHYDISAGLQSFMLNFYANTNKIPFDKTQNKFPLFWNYITDKKYSREQIANILGQTVNDVKTTITSITYGGFKQQYNFGKLNAVYSEFYNENKQLSDFINTNINTINDNDFQTYLNDKITNKSQGKRTQNIVMYSFLEYYEKRIRDILISLMPRSTRYQEVHDAIYSTNPIDILKVKNEIKRQLNFTIDFD